MGLARTRLVALLAVALVGGVQAAEPIRPVAEWSVKGDFEKGAEARTNLSGAACARKAPPSKSCLIVNDQKNYAQFFAINRTRLVPGKVIRLRDEGAEGDPDAEGAAYHNGYFYVIGSHGRTRHGDKPNDASYAVFRFRVGKNGEPAFGVSDTKPVGVAASDRLRGAIREAAELGKFYDTPLSQNGANIEGIAVKRGRMYLGFRGPSVAGRGFILSADANAVFSDSKKLNAKLDTVALGETTGIRDLAPVENGILILSGPVNEQAVTPAVYHWNEQTGALRKLGDLAIPDAHKKHKAETLLVLRDAKKKPYRVLVMFDGPENGGPTEYVIPR
jgi:hypothetical protein